jgi:GDP-4-dehydro-6-deoxy-D-mannose reductase
VRVLVTGVSGFVGGHLAAHLAEASPQAELYGTVRRSEERALVPAGVQAVEADLTDYFSVEAALEAVRPDRIVHLAAQSSVQQSWVDPAGTLRVNVHGLLHLLEALRRAKRAPRVLVVGSADEYGAAPRERQPVGEDAPLLPGSPYAVSKVAQGFLALQYALAHGMPIVRTRTFPHTGPGRGELFAEASFARQIAEIESGLRPPRLEVGNLDVVRDFCDVRDVVRAYWLLIEKGEPGAVYNVCSGRGVSIREVLERLLALSDARADVQTDPARLRPSDIPVLVGSNERLRAATAWQPTFSLEQTLRDLLDDWRRRVREAARA